MKIKKIIAILITAALAVGLLAGCGGNDNPPNEDNNAPPSVTDDDRNIATAFPASFKHNDINVTVTGYEIIQSTDGNMITIHIYGENVVFFIEEANTAAALIECEYETNNKKYTDYNVGYDIFSVTPVNTSKVSFIFETGIMPEIVTIRDGFVDSGKVIISFNVADTPQKEN
ncbi:MAG: hypothetical protein FWH17_10640 [Oscillospiraceae bacterium]|nr:hypothetical protein [Oscillospiraceae bacterium]